MKEARIEENTTKQTRENVFFFDFSEQTYYEQMK
jgi:hypothetical protein